MPHKDPASHPGKLRGAALPLALTLALVSTLFFYDRVISPQVKQRVRHVEAFFRGEQQPPYQYRSLTPLLERALGYLLPPGMHSQARHRFISFLIVFLALASFFHLFYCYLSWLFSRNAALVGVLLLQAVIPLSITGYYMDGDFVTVAFLAGALALMQTRHDKYLPVIVALASLNREQSIFIAILYGIYVASEKTINRRQIAVFVSSVIAWLVVFLGTRWFFGDKPTRYTNALHIAHNTKTSTLVDQIIPLWSVAVLPFVLLSFFSLRGSNRFLQWSFASLLPYTVLFFFKGNMWELGKFLPAYMIMIPLCIQTLTGERCQIGQTQSLNEPSRRPTLD